MEKDLKPCVQCGKMTAILPVQLGDFFTLVHLRVCSAECMFLLAYDYLYKIGEHKSFRSSLYKLENEEDCAVRERYQDEVQEESLKMMREHFKANSNMLTQPMPDEILQMFKGWKPIQDCIETVRFTRPSKEDRLKWQKKYVEDQKKLLGEAEKDLLKIESE